MRRALYILALLSLIDVFGTGVHAQISKPDAISQFVLGAQAYKERDYSRAVKEYQAILQGGKESGPLYYNLGNAYFKNAQLGYAVLSYERAKQLIPRDSDLKFNLKYAESLVTKTVSNEASGFFQQLYQGHLDFYTLDEMLIICTILAVILGVVFLFSRFLKWSVPVRVLTRLVLAVFLVIYGAGLFGKINANLNQAVVVEKSTANFEPSDDATVRFELFEGMKVKVVRYKDGWVKVRRSDGILGWVPEVSIEEI